jgi:hypothetical protein
MSSLHSDVSRTNYICTRLVLISLLQILEPIPFSLSKPLESGNFDYDLASALESYSSNRIWKNARETGDVHQALPAVLNVEW